MNGAAAEKSPGTLTSGRCRRPGGLDRDGHRPAADARAGGLEHQLGVVAGRRGLDHGGRAVALSPASRIADFTCALAIGST